MVWDPKDSRAHTAGGEEVLAPAQPWPWFWTKQLEPPGHSFPVFMFKALLQLKPHVFLLHEAWVAVLQARESHSHSWATFVPTALPAGHLLPGIITKMLTEQNCRCLTFFLILKRNVVWFCLYRLEVLYNQGEGKGGWCLYCGGFFKGKWKGEQVNVGGGGHGNSLSASHPRTDRLQPPTTVSPQHQHVSWSLTLLINQAT